MSQDVKEIAVAIAQQQPPQPQENAVAELATKDGVALRMDSIQQLPDTIEKERLIDESNTYSSIC